MTQYYVAYKFIVDEEMAVRNALSTGDEIGGMVSLGDLTDREIELWREYVSQYKKIESLTAWTSDFSPNAIVLVTQAMVDASDIKAKLEFTMLTNNYNSGIVCADIDVYYIDPLQYCYNFAQLLRQTTGRSSTKKGERSPKNAKLPLNARVKMLLEKCPDLTAELVGEILGVARQTIAGTNAWIANRKKVIETRKKNAKVLREKNKNID